ncbi:MAG: hypothetical protein KC505_00075 [Myxococcales bacterium]|nr:hypothetical protein [Myxococcales bacterium]USN50486.1 MAG: hypothetical protein H6731_09520 [Myxococcales bacterium]
MRNLKFGRYLLMASALFLNFSCAQEDGAYNAADEIAPEHIKLEISLKNEAEKTSIAKSLESAPQAASLNPAVKRPCSSRQQAMPMGMGFNQQQGQGQWPNMFSQGQQSQWPNMMNQKAQWPGQAQNSKWGQPYNQGQYQWPNNLNSAPASTTTTVVDNVGEDCYDAAAGAPGFAGAVGYPPPFGPPAPLLNPYGPYFVADIISDDDGFSHRRRRRHHGDDDNYDSDDSAPLSF